MEQSGIVFNIQRFSLHDGPGIRTTVFLKGCAMGCFWCHNPEGRSPKPEIRYDAARCIACGECVRVCPHHAHELRDGVHLFHRSLCETAGRCVDVCCSQALEMVGRRMRVGEVVDELLRDRPFYDATGGGITLSGGEPAMMNGFARILLDACKEQGLHTAIETCGYGSWESIARLLPATDLVMMDIKLLSPERHREATGNPNDLILENARRLACTDKPIVFRTPIVPTVNDSPEEFGQVAAFIRSLVELRRENRAAVEKSPEITFEMLAFHKLAADKYAALGMAYGAARLEPPSKAKLKELMNTAKSHGIEVVVR